jgi:hypothetical protein
MEYNKIIAVTGLPGLYELLSSKSDGAIVRSLDDKTTRFVSSRVHNFSHLESIEVYTVRDNVNLVDILKAMEASSEKLPDEKDNAALKAYFSKVYPDLDFDRVYSSDLKKMVKWFAVLRSNEIEIKLSEPEETPEEEAVLAEPEKTEEKAAKKTAAKETTEPKAKKEAAPEKEEKPAAASLSPKKTAKEAAEPKATASSVKTSKKEAAPEKEEKPAPAARKAAVSSKKTAKEKADDEEEKPKKVAKKK